jgi:hypothetical protein
MSITTSDTQYVWLENSTGHDVKVTMLDGRVVKAGEVIKLRADQVLPEGHTIDEAAGERHPADAAVWAPAQWTQVDEPPAEAPPSEEPAYQQPVDQHDDQVDDQ